MKGVREGGPMEATKKIIPRFTRENPEPTLLRLGRRQKRRLREAADMLADGNMSELLNRWLDDVVTNADLPPRQVAEG